MTTDTQSRRHLGLSAATGVGVGAIVGGGILALAGAVFSVTGPSAMLAFALNGLIALFTALSFAEVSSKFPYSGGTYTFAKMVLSVEAAFSVGWVVWFASIVAAVLYAFGFAEFALVGCEDLYGALLGETPPQFATRSTICGLAATATLFYSARLAWKPAAGGQWINAGKVVVFFVLIAGGAWALRGRSAADIGRSLRPFFAEGGDGLLKAMGFSFIALQGFDLIAAVAGEIRRPERTIPRAMLLSLGLALMIYLPLLLLIATVGVPHGEKVVDVARRDPETLVPLAAANFMGSFGYWLVIVAGVLSMLSALEANLFAASRVAMSMAVDRTLPASLARLHRRRATPVRAIVGTAVIVIVLLLVTPDVAAAGAASSLIFLLSFALAHWIAILVRQRSASRPPPFRVPLYPGVPVLGGLACVALAMYQGIAVPRAGFITATWLSLGGLLFLGLFAQRARITDASQASRDPEIVQLRGHSPLVLVPIVNPDSVRGLAAVAGALAPPETGRVLMLSVVVVPSDWKLRHGTAPIENAQSVLAKSIAASLEAGVYPDALTTIAQEPWSEIARVARLHRCESLLLGLSFIAEGAEGTPMDQLMSGADCDVVVLRAPKNWQLAPARRILVPTAGQGRHDRLLARMLGSLSRTGQREVTFLRVLPRNATLRDQQSAQRDVVSRAADLSAGRARVLILCSDQPVETVAEHAANSDLVILGVQRFSRRRKVFGQFALRLAHRTDSPLLIISARG